jgi:hypothetical protein
VVWPSRNCLLPTPIRRGRRPALPNGSAGVLEGRMVCPGSSRYTHGTRAADASRPTFSLPVTGQESITRAAPTAKSTAVRVRLHAAGSVITVGNDSSMVTSGCCCGTHWGWLVTDDAPSLTGRFRRGAFAGRERSAGRGHGVTTAVSIRPGYDSSSRSRAG